MPIHFKRSRLEYKFDREIDQVKSGESKAFYQSNQAVRTGTESKEIESKINSSDESIRRYDIELILVKIK